MSEIGLESQLTAEAAVELLELSPELLERYDHNRVLRNILALTVCACTDEIAPVVEMDMRDSATEPFFLQERNGITTPSPLTLQIRERLKTADPQIRILSIQAADELAFQCVDALPESIVKPSYLCGEKGIVTPKGMANFLIRLDAPKGEYRKIIEYGPGARGINNIEAQLYFFCKELRPFDYVAISAEPFADAVLRNYIRRRTLHYEQKVSMEPGRAAQLLWHETGLFTGRIDGMAEGSAAIINELRENGQSTETADLIIASFVHKAGDEAIAAGFANAHVLLKPGGALFVLAPDQVDRSSDTPFEVMRAAALDAGFEKRKAQDLGESKQVKADRSMIRGMAFVK